MSSGTVVYARDEDKNSHQPSETDGDNFHETWYLAWYDDRHKAVGFHHIGQYRKRGIADVWSWIALDGKVIAQYENLELPLAEGDHTDFGLGGITVLSKDGLTQAVDVTHGNVSANVEYSAYTRPFSFSMDDHGVGYGAGHLESMGRVAGTITTPDGAVDISGFGYHDHSWGARDYGAVLAQRWVYGVFGPDLFFSAMSFVLPDTTMHRGFVFDGGEFHGIEEASYGIRVATDGHTPEACDLSIYTADGRGYRTTGRVTTSGTSRHNDGYFQTDGFGPMELGGRIGSTQVHIRERQGPPPLIDPQSAR